MSSNVKKCSACGNASIEHCLQCKCWAVGSNLDSEKKNKKKEIKMSAEGLTTTNGVERTKVDKAMIIVEGTKEKPYFEILYHEIGKDFDNIGFGSYDLNNVFDWKEQHLEVVKVEVQNDKMEYKLNCFGQWEDTARCGMCPDEGTCECETKYQEDKKEGKSNGKTRV